MSANPYVRGWREWDERYADLVLGKRNWQIAAGCSLLISLVLAVGIVWLALCSRYVLYFVVTDRLGQAITIPKPLTPASTPMAAASRFPSTQASSTLRTPSQDRTCRSDLSAKSTDLRAGSLVARRSRICVLGALGYSL